ncbi:MAG: hypothetical protein ACRD4B_06440 [Acidobacteriota bacterium]
MSLGSFLLGSILMAIGFVMVWRTNWFIQNFGDLGDAFGITNANWMSWKVFGVGFLFLGFLIALGILQLFLAATLGRFFIFNI